MAGFGTALATTQPSNAVAVAVVYLDPAMYGDQENRISAVDSLKESVRRAILQKPLTLSTVNIVRLLQNHNCFSEDA